ncbi:Hypothetical predicted protein [Paramuricea clavata]|uniref:Uncharacterized protein n=1 Tax=Paramuricea clavata TaxID=317549 RepID=A0A7D9DN28_PARCT|nr:Hypothetical predicted protein [Paramuricea clavata]
MSQIFTEEETNARHAVSPLFVQEGKEIASVEGTTQGDPISMHMPLYAVSITLLLQKINVAHEGLTEEIVEQNKVREDRPAEPVQRIRRRVANERKKRHKVQLALLRSTMSAEQIRINYLAQLKSSSIWLTALPLADEEYVIHKLEFFEAIYLCCRWELKLLATHSAC